jgi:hypothetical protein
MEGMGVLGVHPEGFVTSEPIHSRIFGAAAKTKAVIWGHFQTGNTTLGLSGNE